MKIAGLQKITLVDYPGRIACTIFLYGCNFRCGFCHNPELVISKNSNIISEKDILNYLKDKRKYLDGICITGGEPLLTLNKDFVKQIKSLGYNIKLDTNGSFPDKLKEFIDEGLIDFIAMDIKAPKNKYRLVSGSDINLEFIERSIKIIANSGIDYEFRTTIIPDIHNIFGMKEIGIWINKLIGGKPRKYVLQGFKNKGKFIDDKYKSKDDIEENFLIEIKENIKNYFEEIVIRV